LSWDDTKYKNVLRKDVLWWIGLMGVTWCLGAVARSGWLQARISEAGCWRGSRRRRQAATAAAGRTTVAGDRKPVVGRREGRRHAYRATRPKIATAAIPSLFLSPTTDVSASAPHPAELKAIY